jgi:hypothetical protein
MLDALTGYSAIDPATFRAAYPQFADVIVYPPETVTYWIARGIDRLDPLRWAELYNEGLTLFVAHNLAMARQAQLSGGGGAGAPVSSKSVGGVSIAYNWEVGNVAGAGAYGQTMYGRQFYQLAMMVGMGGIQL